MPDIERFARLLEDKFVEPPVAFEVADFSRRGNPAQRWERHPFSPSGRGGQGRKKYSGQRGDGIRAMLQNERLNLRSAGWAQNRLYT